MQAKVKWLDDMRFIGTSGSGHALVMDGAGPEGEAPSPMEMVLMAVGGCSSVDVVSILKKARQDVRDVEVLIKADRADTTPRVFTAIALEFVVTGHDVSDNHVQRAVALSMDKYCSVSKMLEQAAEISHSYRIVEVEPAA